MSMTWTPLANSPGKAVTGMWLMLDGSILANIYGSTQLISLHPDNTGSYANGTFINVGNFLLEKRAYAAAVLSDGKLVTLGGEFSGPNLPEHETNYCEIYDPVSQTPTMVTPPPGWPHIGDAPTAMLNDGTLIVGNTQGLGQQLALLNPSTLGWSFGGGDSDNEQGYTLLQTGDVLTTGVYTPTSQRYVSSKNAFIPDAPLPTMLGATFFVSSAATSGEIGPGLTLMDGSVIWFGASGATCIYSTGAAGQNGSWVQGPNFPLAEGPNFQPFEQGFQLVSADVPAILEPNGKVLVGASAMQGSMADAQMGSNTLGTLCLCEYDPVAKTLTYVSNAPADVVKGFSLLLLPNGHGLAAFGSGKWYDIEFTAGGKSSWAPTITSFPAKVTAGTTVTLTGTQLCGLSECYSFGDDNQQAENYPMVRFIDLSGNVTYARAHDVSTRSIAPGQTATVQVDIPSSFAGPCNGIRTALANLSRGDFNSAQAYEAAFHSLEAQLLACEKGPNAHVEVVAMGIASGKVGVTFA
jgi:hypothetical protein